jgi:hypothetical protein
MYAGAAIGAGAETEPSAIFDACPAETVFVSIFTALLPFFVGFPHPHETLSRAANRHPLAPFAFIIGIRYTRYNDGASFNGRQTAEKIGAPRVVFSEIQSRALSPTLLLQQTRDGA